MRRRYEDWPRRLAAAIQAARARPFQWGEADCALWAADVVLGLTGEDLAAAFRGRYATRAGAVALLGARGGLEAVVTAALGEPLASPRLARRGDVVMVSTAEGPALGICDGAVGWFTGPTGLVAQRMSDWTKAWRV